MIDYEKFQKSLKQLELQFENYQSPHEGGAFNDLDRQALKESVIQRFETCYDTLWKHLKRHLIEELGLPEAPNSPKPVFRLADENQLLDSRLEQWLKYSDIRVDTAHDYSEEKADACLEIMAPFIDDAIGLYQTLTGKTWE
ncbi:MAG: nucleotidyltransferase substrate binding protein [Elusimicrobia bacterium]|nr:nucleotidyltransferase substrate binding protein [Elusimicrobiota bacterium]